MIEQVKSFMNEFFKQWFYYLKNLGNPHVSYLDKMVVLFSTLVLVFVVVAWLISLLSHIF